LLRRSARSAARSAKYVAKSKQVTEDVFYAAESRGPPIGAGRTRDTGVSESVIAASLFGIGKHRICFSGLFEFIFSFRVTLILVGMILMGELAVSAL
jgi:hypothetical protein